MDQEQDHSSPAPKPEKKPARPKKQAAPKAVQADAGSVADRWASAGPDDELIITPEEVAAMAALWAPEEERPGKSAKNADGRRRWRFWGRK